MWITVLYSSEFDSIGQNRLFLFAQASFVKLWRSRASADESKQAPSGARETTCISHDLCVIAVLSSGHTSSIHHILHPHPPPNPSPSDPHQKRHKNALRHRRHEQKLDPPPTLGVGDGRYDGFSRGRGDGWVGEEDVFERAELMISNRIEGTAEKTRGGISDMMGYV